MTSFQSLRNIQNKLRKEYGEGIQEEEDGKLVNQILTITYIETSLKLVIDLSTKSDQKFIILIAEK